MQKEEEAIKDLNYGLRINPSHACSLILRGNIKQYMRPENNLSLLLNDDQEQVIYVYYDSELNTSSGDNHHCLKN